MQSEWGFTMSDKEDDQTATSDAMQPLTDDDDGGFVSMEPPSEAAKQAAKDHAESQKAKSRFVFGSMNQSDFYKALAKKNDVVVLNKFNQSGVTGFLPMADSGVCAFMSKDFARAVTEGRFFTWQEKIAARDAQMIARLRAGQNNGGYGLGFHGEKHLQEFEESVRGSPSSITSSASSRFDTATHAPDSPLTTTPTTPQSPDSPATLMRRDAASQSIAQAFTGFTAEMSCMSSPCVFLNVTLERKGVLSKVLDKVNPGANLFGHGMMFTMATTKKGKLDPDHLLFMDPNAGIFKIKNNPDAIQQFMTLIDKKLLSDFYVHDIQAAPIPTPWLPQKDSPEWQTQEAALLSGRAEDHPSNYALPEACLVDEYLRTQIERLEQKKEEGMGRLAKAFFKGSERKLVVLNACRKELLDALKAYPRADRKTREGELERLQEALLDKVDKAVSEKRFLFAVRESTSKSELSSLKKRLAEIKAKPKEPDVAPQQAPKEEEEDSLSASPPPGQGL